MFEHFDRLMVETGEATIHARRGGDGPPILLLHGFPETHVMWHKVAPRLARDFTVVAADLRGYGGSSRPPTTADHAPYSKRAMARDMVALMQHFGFDRFSVAGHDRGGRCAYRLALDHPDRVHRLAVLDIIPTGEAFRRADMAFALGFLALVVSRAATSLARISHRGESPSDRRLCARHVERGPWRLPRRGAR